jgi:hypothetical protein
MSSLSIPGEKPTSERRGRQGQLGGWEFVRQQAFALMV